MFRGRLGTVCGRLFAPRGGARARGQRGDHERARREPAAARRGAIPGPPPASPSDFPDTCAIGACGCPPSSSDEVAVCSGGAGQCFNGAECVEKQGWGLRPGD